MLMLLFWIEAERWAIATAEIRDVLPLVNLQPASHSHPMLAGWLNYRGNMVRTIDVSKIVAGKAAPVVMSTRVAIAEIAGELLGLIVERVEKTARFPADGSDRKENCDESLRRSAYVQTTMRDDQGVVHQLSLAAIRRQLKVSDPLSSASVPQPSQHLNGVC